MREIKFRALQEGGRGIPGERWVYWEIGQTPNYVFLDMKTVGQFTGLHDKNGKEIYEGDILRITGAFIGDSYIKPYNGYIYFVNGGFEISGDALFDTLSVNPCYWEVIGNRHENPELLKGDL